MEPNPVQVNQPTPVVNTPPTPPTVSRTNFIPIIIVGLIMLLLGLGGGYFIFGSKNTKQSEKSQTAMRPSPTIVQSVSPTSSSVVAWKSYTTSAGGFSIMYPSDWQVSEDCNNATVGMGYCISSSDYHFSDAIDMNGTQQGALFAVRFNHQTN